MKASLFKDCLTDGGSSVRQAVQPFLYARHPNKTLQEEPWFDYEAYNYGERGYDIRWTLK